MERIKRRTTVYRTLSSKTQKTEIASIGEVEKALKSIMYKVAYVKHGKVWKR